ncbi:MAG: radical SAM protein [Bacteroidia bacterium]|nr:radical SAM protein [Bacteroidia bacterium]
MCDIGTGYSESNFAQNLTGTHPLHMPFELITEIMDQASTHFPEVKIGYAFTEPLAYKHLEESLRYAKTKKLYTSLTTNALTLPQKAEALCETELNELNISLDGPQSIHNEIRGNNQSFQKALQGMEKLFSQQQHPDVSVFCVITEWNIGHLNDFISNFINYPLKQIGFMHTNFTPDWLATAHNKKYGEKYHATLSNTEEVHIEEMNLDVLWEEIQSIHSGKFNFPITFSPEINSKADLQRFYLKPEIFFGKICNDSFRNLMIKSDGSVIPSHGRCFNLTVGNVYSQNIKDIWNGSLISEFRKDLMNAGGLFPACSRCCSAF